MVQPSMTGIGVQGNEKSLGGMATAGFKEKVRPEQGLDTDSGWIEMRREKGGVRGGNGGDQPDGLAGDLRISVDTYAALGAQR